jgi:hypothetical protein
MSIKYNSDSSKSSNSCDEEVKCQAINTKKRKNKQDKISCYIDILKEKYNISDDEIEKLLTLVTPKKRKEKNDEEVKPKKTNGYQLYIREYYDNNKGGTLKEVSSLWSKEDKEIKEEYKERANKQNINNGFTDKNK